MDGLLVVDKPVGPTSHDVVARVRRALRVTKVGHTGTLDPMASGVLPLVLGRGTKLARYVSGDRKAYRATLQLGVTTTTLDAEGEVVMKRDVPQLDVDTIQRALAPLRGPIMQRPPMYSAKKIDGKKLYELARKGIELEREAKPVEVFELELEDSSAHELVLRMVCSAGTYVRVLAADLGEALGCGAHLTALRRLSAGPFELEAAVSLEALELQPAIAQERLLPLDSALGGLPRIDLPKDVGRQILHGYQLNVGDLRVVDTPQFAQQDAITVGTFGGQIIAVVRAEIPSEDLALSRRDRRALKTERVLCAEL